MFSLSWWTNRLDPVVLAQINPGVWQRPHPWFDVFLLDEAAETTFRAYFRPWPLAMDQAIPHRRDPNGPGDWSEHFGDRWDDFCTQKTSV